MNYKEMFLRGEMPQLKIYDAHAHIETLPNTTPENTDYKSIIAGMDRYNILKTVVSSSNALLRKNSGNDEVYDAVVNSNGKIMGYVTVNPNIERGTIDEIKRFENGVMSGIKYHPNYAGTPINDDKMKECLSYINEKGYIMLVHAYSLGQVQEMEEIIPLYPEIKFIIAHSGTESGYKLTAELIKKYENVYCDLSMSVQRANMLEHIVNYGDENKILLGSDSPLTDPSVPIGRIMLTDISDSAKEKILGLNFEKLFYNAKI